MNEIGRVLDLYAWGGVIFLLVVLYRIAHFYQATADECSHYRWFALPLVLFLLAAVRYAWVGGFAGDPWGDGLLVLGGGSLLALGYRLLDLMTGDRS
ncbi:MAG: hypothetical protein JW850_08240 [Thermoflexales bacterium]|nr:hypothetical protein [Thermoflexales bacterium]